VPKSPTPSPSRGPQPPAPKVPTVPDYNGSAGTTPTPSSGAGSNDIWGLGQVYGLPVFLGSSTTSPGSYSGAEPTQHRGGVGVQTHDQYGTTQDIMQQVIDLWAAQQTERKGKKGGLTSYEQLQQALYAGGFYGQTSYDKIHVGQWTPQTQNAVVSALQQYEQVMSGAQSPVTFTEFLQGNAAQNGDGGFYADGTKKGAPEPTISVSDPAAIKAAVQSAAQEALGMGLSDDQLNTFVAKFQSAQTSAQTNTGTVTVPDLSSDAMAFAQQSDPQGFHQNQRTAYLDQLVNLLGGGLTSRPNQQPVASVGGAQ
jgi:hypothetical protein